MTTAAGNLRRIRRLEKERARNATPEGIAARRAVEMLSRHGLTQAQYEALMEAQKGRCAICETTFTVYSPNAPWRGQKPACVDHDHTTGKVRGLLCRGCNTAEGWVAKKYEKLQAYLASPPAKLLDFA